MMFSPGGGTAQMHGGGGHTGFRHTAEDRERLMNRQYFDRDLGELQKSIERGSLHYKVHIIILRI